MKERNIQGYFSRYILNNLPNESVAWELKLVNLEKTKSKSFSCVDDHQIDALLKVEGDGLYWKIPDTAAISGFTSPKPFDCFLLKGKAYVVPVFYEPRKRKTAYLIRIKNWINMRDNCGRKSFNEEMCQQIKNDIIEL